MQNIKDPDQKIQMTRYLKTTPSALSILPVHIPFIMMFQIFLLKEEMLEHETKMVSCILTDKQCKTDFLMINY
jgi:hypothetical protein